jgi:preprotein translocase subunit SecD
MPFFYHRPGLFSVIGLFLNMLFLVGSLALLQATLTLPVAGIILTLGMAVDGNILIYERLREELNRGLKLVQAAKNAFEKAAVTIIRLEPDDADRGHHPPERRNRPDQGIRGHAEHRILSTPSR